jgi:hypothetical protein
MYAASERKYKNMDKSNAPGLSFVDEGEFEAREVAFYCIRIVCRGWRGGVVTCASRNSIQPRARVDRG